MELIKGISKETQGNCTLYHITSLTDEIKEELRRFLVAICYGEEKASWDIDAYSYQNTLESVLLRCSQQGKTPPEDRIKGMVGELLAHLLFRIEGEFHIASAFFNLEEKSFKKGFDIILLDTTNNTIWITEIKSGEKHVDAKNVSDAIKDLINEAKLDLKKRLNNDNIVLWDNAINAARNAMIDSTDEKKAVVDILKGYINKAAKKEIRSSQENVILLGNLFHPLSELSSIDILKEKHTEICDKKLFGNTIIIATQQETYNNIYNFLKSEAQSWQKN